EVEFIRKMGVTLVTAATAHRWTGTQLADEIGSRIGSDALHISLDIDSLDPSIAPGTGVPSAGGLTSRELLDFLRQLRGVRLRSEVEFIRKMGVTLVTAATAHRWTGTQLADEIGSRIGSDALHISLDIDSLDPSIAPGTGVPSAGGLTSRELLDFLRQLRGVRL